jgi:phage/plasmid-associated DNA primase
MILQFHAVCNGAPSKALCANAVRTWLPTEIPVTKNGFLMTGAYPDGTFLAVVDFDIKPGSTYNPEDLPPSFQDTMLVRTGSGGLHVYLNVDGEVHNTASKEPVDDRLREIDTRGQGGIIFAPGCKFVEHPRPYTIINDVPIKHMAAAEYTTILTSLVRGLVPTTTAVASSVQPPRVAPKLKYTKNVADAKLSPQAMDILTGHFVLEHATQSTTGQSEHLYWQWLVRVLASSGVDPCGQDVFDLLRQFQPEFDEPTYRYQLTKVGYLNIPPKATFTRKLFPGVTVEGEMEKKAQVGDDDWEAVKAKLLELPYIYAVVKKDGTGFWTRANDGIDSWYASTGKVTKDLESIVQEWLGQIKMFKNGDVIEMMSQLNRARNVDVSYFSNVNRDIIHFQNGIYHVKWKEFTRRDQPLPDKWKDVARRTFRVIPVDYDPDFDVHYPIEIKEWRDLSPSRLYIIEWERTLHRMLDSHEHPGQYERFWQWLGYCLSSYIDLNKAAILEGDPDCAKTSTWMTFVSYLEPENKELSITAHVDFAEVCEPKDIEFSKYVDGKLIWYDDEMGKEPIKTYTKFKKRISEEVGKVRELYVGSYNADRVGKFTGCVNILPVVYGISESFGKRMMPFFCQNPYTKDEKDESLVHAMRKSPALGRYIVRKAIMYLHDLLSTGWRNAMTADEVVHWWLLKSDVVYSFVTTMCERVKMIPDSSEVDDTWEAFTRYRDASGMEYSSKYAATKGDFTAVLGGYRPPFPKRDTHRKKTVENKKTGEMVEKDSVHVEVYLGLKVNYEKLEQLLGSETVDLLTNTRTPPVPTAAEMEPIIEKDIMTALNTTLGGNVSFQRAQIIMNAYNANNNKLYTMEQWVPVIDVLVQKGKVLKSDDCIMLAPKKAKAEPAPKEKKAVIVPEQDPMDLLLGTPAPAPTKDFSDATLDDDVDMSAIMAIQDKRTTITVEVVHDEVPSITAQRASLLLRRMELDKMVVHKGEGIYAFT